MLTNKSAKTIACQLPESELQTRIEVEIRQLVERVNGVAEFEEGFVLTFPSNDEILAQLFTLVSQERTCCSFFNFEVHVPSNFQDFKLLISGPPEGKAFVEQLLPNLIKRLQD